MTFYLHREAELAAVEEQGRQVQLGRKGRLARQAQPGLLVRQVYKARLAPRALLVRRGRLVLPERQAP